MPELKSYILSVVAAGVVCALTVHLVGAGKPQTTVIRLLAGLFMAVTVTAPLSGFQLSRISGDLDAIGQYSRQAVSDGENLARQQRDVIIKENAEAYILDKAGKLGVDIQVSVLLSEGEPPIPEQAQISGAVSPYAKSQLTQYIREDLGIPKENLKWK